MLPSKRTHLVLHAAVVLVDLLQEGVAALEGRERARHAALARVRALISCFRALLLVDLLLLPLHGRRRGLRRRLEREDQLGQRVQLGADLIVQVAVEEVDGLGVRRRGRPLVLLLALLGFDGGPPPRPPSRARDAGAAAGERCHCARAGLGGMEGEERMVERGAGGERGLVCEGVLCVWGALGVFFGMMVHSCARAD